MTGEEKIIVIEDDPRVIKVMKGLFPLLKINADFAENGTDGIKIINEQIPDLIICDIMLPDMQGYDVLSAIKGNAKTYRIPFIFLSAFSEPTDIRKGMDLGADDYLTKPFTSSTLLKTIEARLEIKKRNEQIDITLENDKWLSVFSGSFNHEFMTPLNGIMNAVELMKQNNKMAHPAMFEELGNAIYSSGYRMMRNTKKLVINNYFHSSQKVFARLEAINNLDAILKDSIQQLNRQYFDKNIQINLSSNLIDAKVLGNYEYIKFLFDELLDNAYKFNCDKTPINIILNKTDNQNVVFEVSNHTDLEESIFNQNAIMPFRKFHSNWDMIGLGLGLINCVKICDFLSYGFVLNNSSGCVKTTITIKLLIEQTTKLNS